MPIRWHICWVSKTVLVPQGRFCSSPGQLQDLCAVLMGVTLTPMGRQEASSHPTTLYISHSVGFIVKLLLQSNLPEQCASTISRRVCPQTLCLSLHNPLIPSSCKLVTWQECEIKRWLSQLPLFTCLGRSEGGSWEGACPNLKAPSFEREVCLGVYREQERNCSPVQEEREGREGGVTRPLQTWGFPGRVPEH